jgi:hypothetical protein
VAARKAKRHDRRSVQSRTILAVFSVGVALSFAFMALNGPGIPSLWGPGEIEDPSERVQANDWPSDYLNGTLTSVGAIHSDFSTYQGTGVTVQGIVTAATAEYEGWYFFMQDSTGGIAVNVSGSGFSYGLSRGDSVRLNGTVGITAEGMHTIEGSLSYWVISTGNSLEVEHIYNSTLVGDDYQGMLARMSGYLCGLVWDNYTETGPPSWTRVVVTGTLWMYGRTFQAQATNISLEDHGGFVSVVGVIFTDGGQLTLRPRSDADLVDGSGPYHSPDVDCSMTGWATSEMAVDDADDDSLYPGNEIEEMYITWDADSLYVAVTVTVDPPPDMYPVIVYIDAYRGATGATNVSAMDSWSRHYDFQDGFSADYMLVGYNTMGGSIFECRRLLSNDATTDITGSVAGLFDGAVMEVAIPWNTMFGLGPGVVPSGATLRVIGTITVGDGSNAGDSAPDNTLYPSWNGWSHLAYYYDFVLDADLDGTPDDYSSGYEIPEFSLVIMVPLVAALFIVVARRRRT